MTNDSQKQKNNKLPPHLKLTETVNFLRKGRNVADTLWSVHIIYEIFYLLGINNAK